MAALENMARCRLRDGGSPQRGNIACHEQLRKRLEADAQHRSYTCYGDLPVGVRVERPVNGNRLELPKSSSKQWITGDRGSPTRIQRYGRLAQLVRRAAALTQYSRANRAT